MKLSADSEFSFLDTEEIAKMQNWQKVKVVNSV